MDTEMTEEIGPPSPPPPTQPPTQPPTPPPAPDGTPAPPPAPGRMPLRRSTSDTMLGGVCSGLGRRYGIDPAVLRVLFVVGVFAAGLGLLLYLAMWLLVPDDTDTSSNWLTSSLWRLVLGVLLAMGSVAALFGWLHSLRGFGGLILGGAIVGLGVWLYSRRDLASTRRRATPATTATPDTAPPTGFAYGGTGGTGEPAASYQYDDPTVTYPTVTPKSPKQRSYLGLITLLASVVVAGLLGILHAAGLIQLSAVAFLSVLLAVLAIGLLVGAFVGRARWLIAPALVLALALGVVAPISPYVSTTVDAGVGERVWQPTSADLDYQLGVGSATLDLTEWARDPRAADPELPDAIKVEVALGELKVLVPETWQVFVDADVQLGDLKLNGIPVGDAEPEVEYRGVLPARGEATGRIVLDLSVFVGQVDVDQVPVAAVTKKEQRDSGSAGSVQDDAPQQSNRGADGDNDDPALDSSSQKNDATKSDNTKSDSRKNSQKENA